jgi:hypothetical protein
MSSPYRTHATTDSTADDHDGDWVPDADLIPVLTVVWLASVARVVAGVALGETMGAETTMALLTVVFVPVVISEPVACWWNRRCTTRREAERTSPRSSRTRVAGARKA